MGDQIYHLRDGIDITRQDYRGAHRYLVEGDERVAGLKLPSVTTVLNIMAKPALVAWAERQGIQAAIRAIHTAPGPDPWPVLNDTEGLTNHAQAVLKSESAERMNAGSMMHEALLSYAEGSLKLEDVTEDFRPTAEAFEVWLSDNAVTVTHVEWAVYDPDEGLGGTLDIAGTMGDGTSFVGDLKSSSNVYPEHVAQVAGYESAAAACLPGFAEPARAFVFLAGPDGRFEPHELSQAERMMGRRLLSSALDMYESHRDLRKATREREKEEGSRDV